MSYGSTPPPAPASQPGGYYEQPMTSAGSTGQLADWPQRAMGYIVDLALLLPGYILLWMGMPKATVATSATGIPTIETSGPGITYFLGVLYLIGMSIWNRWIKGGQGQTVGRKVAGVTLVNAQGQPLGPAMAFVRDLAHGLDSLILGLGWLFPLWDAKRQTLADKVLNTTVVTVPK